MLSEEQRKYFNILGLLLLLSLIFSGLSCGNTVLVSGCGVEGVTLAVQLGILLIYYLFRNRIRRAITLYVLYAAMTLGCFIPVLKLCLFYSENIKSAPDYFLGSLILLSCLVGAALFYRYQRTVLFSSRQLNIKSGLIDIKNNRWNLMIPVQSSSAGDVKKWQTVAKLLIPLAPALGGVLYRNTGEYRDIFLLFSGIGLLYIVSIIVVAALAMAGEIADLERTYTKQFLLGNKK